MLSENRPLCQNQLFLPTTIMHLMKSDKNSLQFLIKHSALSILPVLSSVNLSHFESLVKLIKHASVGLNIWNSSECPTLCCLTALLHHSVASLHTCVNIDFSQICGDLPITLVQFHPRVNYLIVAVCLDVNANLSRVFSFKCRDEIAVITHLINARKVP